MSKVSTFKSANTGEDLSWRSLILTWKFLKTIKKWFKIIKKRKNVTDHRNPIRIFQLEVHKKKKFIGNKPSKYLP